MEPSRIPMTETLVSYIKSPKSKIITSAMVPAMLAIVQEWSTESLLII